MTWSRFAGRTLALVALAWLSIELHELGHFTVYTLAGYHARMHLQTVMPMSDVPARVDHLALFAGPAASAILAILFLVIAQSRGGFAWAAASFTNATIRLFPLTMDLIRAVQGGKAFSDEGTLALAVTHSPIGRSCLVVLALAVFLTLAFLAAMAFRFRRFVFWKAFGIYVFTLVIGIGVVLIDELSHFRFIQLQSRSSSASCPSLRT